MLLAALAVGAAPLSAHATTAPTLTLAQQARKADVIVRATLGTPTNVTEGEATWIVYPLTVTETVAGDPASLPQREGRPVLFLLSGLEELPDLRAGQEAFLLLYSRRMDNPIVGFAQGLYPIVNGRVTRSGEAAGPGAGAPPAPGPATPSGTAATTPGAGTAPSTASGASASTTAPGSSTSTTTGTTGPTSAAGNPPPTSPGPATTTPGAPASTSAPGGGAATASPPAATPSGSTSPAGSPPAGDTPATPPPVSTTATPAPNDPANFPSDPAQFRAALRAAREAR